MKKIFAIAAVVAMSMMVFSCKNNKGEEVQEPEAVEATDTVAVADSTVEAADTVAAETVAQAQ